MTWNNFIDLTIDSTYIDEDLTDFPVMIRISPSAGRSLQDITDIFTELGDNQYKFKIEDSDGNKLYTEIDYWSNTEQRANLWVKIPFIDSVTDTTIRIYYDASGGDQTDFVGETGSQPASGVWDDDYIAVWHFSQQTSASLLDSTGSPQHNSTSLVGLDGDERVNAFTGYGIEFNGSDEYIVVGNRQNAFSVDLLTIESLFREDTAGADTPHLFHHGDTAIAGHRGWRPIYDTGQLEFTCWTTGWVTRSSTDMVASAADIYATWTVSAGGAWSDPIKLWYEATQLTVDSGAAMGAMSKPTVDAQIAVLDQAGFSNHWEGRISELRISDIVRSDSWIHASKNSIRDTLITFSRPGHIFNVTRPQVKAATSPLGWKESDIYVKHKGVLRPVQQILLRKNNEWKIMNDITPPIVRKTPPFGPVDLTDGFVDVSPSDNPYSPTADVLTWDHNACNTETYYYKDFGVDFFIGDFQIDFEMEYTVLGVNTSQVGSVTVAEQLGSNANQLGIGGLVHRGSRTQIHMQKFGVSSAMLRDMGAAVTLPNWYYRIERVGTNFTYSVWYTDATRLTAPDLTNTEDWGTTSYRYLIVAAAMGSQQANGGEGTVSNIVINI